MIWQPKKEDVDARLKAGHDVGEGATRPQKQTGARKRLIASR